MKKIVSVKLNIRTGEDNKHCSQDCQFIDVFADECLIFGAIRKRENTDNVFVGEYIRHRTCIKKEI